ncbi:SubName: Full=Uncharacterized protein {ECO:0000313/EMBL:CCA71420.1} [Serendipita indica DSM 11827]|nr:SubName: Full=Uncharacterized protein {ECO:0000313/EMBL:CCA71420.1} [Serendipita indica DSM 11827]
MNLNLLPEALVFEICNYLDIFTLVAFSDCSNPSLKLIKPGLLPITRPIIQVDTSLRSLATTRSSFWIYTLSHCNLVLPCIGDKRLHEHDARELHLAAHRAVFIERNLTSDSPALRSWSRIEWPYPLADGVHETEYSSEETCSEVTTTYLVDDMADWMIFVSSNNILRIVFVRTGRVGLIWDGARFTPEYRERYDVVIKWAIRYAYMDNVKIVASMVMNCCLETENGIRAGIRRIELVMNLQDGTASVEVLGDYETPTISSYLNLIGDLVVMVIPRSSSLTDRFGDVYMLKWSTRTLVTLPHMYPSLRIGLYKEYFINVGLTPTRQIVAQVVPFSTDDLSLAEASNATMPFPDSPLPVLTILFHTTVQPSSQQAAPVALGTCILVDRLEVIFDFTFDFYGLRMALQKMRLYGTAVKQEFEGEPELFRTLEESNLRHRPVPTSSVRRLVWCRQTAPETNASTDTSPIPSSPDHKGRQRFRLLTLRIDDLASASRIFPEVGTSFRAHLDIEEEHPPESACAVQIKASKELQLPTELAESTTDVYVFLLLESSGTAVVQLRSGELWVLRYGKA